MEALKVPEPLNFPFDDGSEGGISFWIDNEDDVCIQITNHETNLRLVIAAGLDYVEALRLRNFLIEYTKYMKPLNE